MSEIVLTLPDDIAEEAEQYGLFKPFIITSMLKAEIRRRKTNKFFEMIDQLAEVSGEPMSNEEINAEIAAAEPSGGTVECESPLIPTRSLSGSLWEGNQRRILTAARDGMIELFTSRPLLDELEDVLTRDKFQAKLLAAKRSARALVSNYAFVATIIEVKEIEPVILRDPDDDAGLACAIASESEIIVSGDNDLLDFKQYNNIRILTATELLSELNL